VTAYSKLTRGHRSKRGNKKDGGQRQRPTVAHFSPEAQAQRFEAAGFVAQGVDGNEWSYTWQGGSKVPVFTLTRGVRVTSGRIFSGYIAEYKAASVVIEMQGGTSPQDIASRLNDEIEKMVWHDATVDEIPLDWKPAGAFIDIDDWMATNG